MSITVQITALAIGLTNTYIENIHSVPIHNTQGISHKCQGFLKHFIKL